jgi:hypothetical protein
MFSVIGLKGCARRSDRLRLEAPATIAGAAVRSLSVTTGASIVEYTILKGYHVMVTKSKDLAEVERPYQEFQRNLIQRAELESGLGGEASAFEIASRVVDEIATATTDTDVFAANEGGGVDLEEFLNIPFICTNLVVRQSEEKYRKNGLGVYVQFNAVFDNGETVMLSTGATNVVASIIKLEQLGYITPGNSYKIKVVGKTTAKGTLYKLAQG